MQREYNRDSFKPKILKEPEYLDIEAEKPIKVTRKVLIPSYRNPTINYVGRIIGPKGVCIKKLAEEFNCVICVLGQGSTNDKVLEKAMLKSGDPKYAHFAEPLHVKIETIAAPTLAFTRISDLMERLFSVLKSANPYKRVNEVQAPRSNHNYEPNKQVRKGLNGWSDDEEQPKKPIRKILNGWSDTEDQPKKSKVVLLPGIAIHTTSFSQPPPAFNPVRALPSIKSSDFPTIDAPRKPGQFESVFKNSKITDKPTLKKSTGSVELGKEILKILNGPNDTLNASQVCVPGDASFHTIGSRPRVNSVSLLKKNVPTVDPQEAVKLPPSFGRSKSMMRTDPNGNLAGLMTTPSRAGSGIRKRHLEFGAEEEQEFSPAKKLASAISHHSPIGPKSMSRGSASRRILHSTFVKKE